MDVDVIFTALPNGEAQKISNKLKKHNTLIDLSADFRLKNAKTYFKYYKLKHSSVKNIKKSIYALPEIKNKTITFLRKSKSNESFNTVLKFMLSNLCCFNPWLDASRITLSIFNSLSFFNIL